MYSDVAATTTPGCAVAVKIQLERYFVMRSGNSNYSRYVASNNSQRVEDAVLYAFTKRMSA